MRALLGVLLSISILAVSVYLWLGPSEAPRCVRLARSERIEESKAPLVERFRANLSQTRVLGEGSFLERDALPATVRARVGSAGSMIELFGIDRPSEDVDVVAIHMQVSAGRTRPRLYWIRDDELEPAPESTVNFPWNFDGKDHTETVRVSDSPAWRGRIRALRLVPTDVPADVVIRDVGGLGFKTPTTGRARVTLGTDGREAILTAKSESLPFTVVPDRGSRLDFAIGVPQEAWNRRGGPVTFVVRVNGVERFRRTLDPRSRPEERRWFDAGIDLDDRAGRRTEIRLEAAFEPGDPFPRAAFGAPIVHAPSVRAGARHVVLVSLDTLRADHLGCYGYSKQTSPRIDALASRGVRFESAVSNAPETLESHMTLFTSLHPSEHGVYRQTHRLSSAVPTLAMALGAAGFLTNGFVEGGYISSTFGFDNGFDRYDEGQPRPDGVKSDIGHTFEKAVAEIRAHHDRDTFTFVHTYEIHTPYAPPPRLLSLFESGYDGTLTNVLPFLPDSVRLFASPEPPSPSDVAHVIALYDAGIRHADEWVGKLVDALDASDLAASTLLVLLSDHGEDLMDHGTIANHGQSLYEEVLRVPLIACGPGVPAGASLTGTVSLVDVAPSILEWLDLPLPGTFQGKSFRSAVLRGRVNDGLAIAEDLSTFRRAAVRRDLTKYIRTRSIERDRVRPLLDLLQGPQREWRPKLESIYLHSRREEYYDLAADPRELDDRAARDAPRCLAERRVIDEFLNSAQVVRRRLGGALETSMSAAEIARLTALGYLGDNGSPATSLEEEIASESREEPVDGG